MSDFYPIRRANPITQEFETVGEIGISGVIKFYVDEGFKFVLEPIITQQTGQPVLVGFDLRPYPADYEMEAGF